MPFKSGEQEVAMQINAPEVWKKWVEKYGHHPDWKKVLRRGKKKKKAKLRKWR